MQRERSAEDRRKVNLHLTPSGHATCEELIPLVVEKLNAAVADFSRAELDEMTRLISKFIAGMQGELAGSDDTTDIGRTEHTREGVT